MEYSVEKVTSVIRKVWTADTSASPDEWTPDTPALGQCVPSSLVAQDLLGGQLERLATERGGKRETHYRNILPNGDRLDVSGDQYADGQVFEPAPIDGDLREYVLANERTYMRYRMLCRRAMCLLELEG